MQGQSRVIIERVYPEIDNGLYPIKRVVGELVRVSADLFGDGHDVIQGSVLYKHITEKKWREARLQPLINDRWETAFQVEKQGFYEYKVIGWVDHALNWRHGIHRKIDDGQHVNIELLDGVQYLEYVRGKVAAKDDKTYLDRAIALFQSENDYKEAVQLADDNRLKELFIEYPSKKFLTEYGPLQIYVDRKKALFSSWYEFFPRSASETPGKHGTFKDCERLLPRVADMGFDVLYFPPVHPIGRVNRKGKNNTTTALEGDVGSPWGIGSEEGGHMAIHPELGTLEDYKHLIREAEKLGIEIAMDFALQCAPDHPFVKEHPQWFLWRPDGSVQYAENPPKKYQDILPIHFETEDWKNLWEALTNIAVYWVRQGIRIFRVDNPHTKPYRFWEHLIREVKKVNPDVLFLAEAFTRPKVMHALAKVGFSQSYTYYTWRNTKRELEEYMIELTRTEGSEYFRPNFWPNTPDINPYLLQSGNESLFMSRLFMAATLSSNYGIYGPVYEYLIHEALPGREEYLDSEKFEIKHYDWNKKTKMTYLISMINKIRKEEEALHYTNNIQLCRIDTNENLLAYYKAYGDSRLLMVVNLDPYHSQVGMVQMPLDQIGVKAGTQYEMRDLITGDGFIWSQEWNYVELHPNLPFHLLKVRTL